MPKLKTSMLEIPAGSQVIVPDAVIHVPGWLAGPEADRLCAAITEETMPHWTPQFSFTKGKRLDKGHTMSRFGDPGVTYSFKGKPKPVHPLSPALLEVRQLVAASLCWCPNCIVVNTYEPASGLYPHRDSTYIPQLGPDPVIVAVSFGSTRTFRLTPHDVITNKYTGQPAIDVELGNGDLIIMCGDCDSRFKHGIPEQPDRLGTRLSLTFRMHL